MTVVLLTGDLMVVSRVAGAVAAAGMELHTASSAPQAEVICREVPADLLIVDLALPSLDIAELAASVKTGSAKPPLVVAFGPHVQEQRLAAAREAGCDHVVSRGQFFGRVEAILKI